MLGEDHPLNVSNALAAIIYYTTLILLGKSGDSSIQASKASSVQSVNRYEAFLRILYSIHGHVMVNLIALHSKSCVLA